MSVVVPFLGALLAMSAATAVRAQDGDTPRDPRSSTVVACVVAQAHYVRAAAPAAANADGAQFLLADPRSGELEYSLSGVREAELHAHAGRRVEITGVIEPARTTPVLATVEGSEPGVIVSEAPGAAGKTPEGGPAHEASDALRATVQAGAVAEPDEVTDPAYEIGRLPRLNATTFRVIEGSCVPPPAEAIRAADAAPVQTSATPLAPALPPTRGPALLPVVLRGCLVRQTAGGTALTPAPDSSDPLVLTRAAVISERQDVEAGAVPGSSAGDRGSGTVPRVAGTTGSVSVDVPPQAFVLAMSDDHRATLAPRVGELVEITGTMQPPRSTAPAGGAADEAHPSAPAERVTVSSFRPVGGACR